MFKDESVDVIKSNTVSSKHVSGRLRTKKTSGAATNKSCPKTGANPDDAEILLAI